MEILIALAVALAAVAAVLYPLIRGDGQGVPLESEEPPTSSASTVEQDVERYRAAIRAGTLCRRCGRANPEGSRFCAECGRALAAGASRRGRRSLG